MFADMNRVMRDIPGECYICDDTAAKVEGRNREATVHEILDRTKAIAQDIHESASYIRCTLFGETNPANAAPQRPVTCAREAMIDICEELVEINEILTYIRGRL